MSHFLKMFVAGAATALGGLVVNKADKVLSDPYKRAQIKNKFKRAKTEFTRTDA